MVKYREIDRDVEIIKLLKERGGLSASEIAELTAVPQPSIYRRLKALLGVNSIVIDAKASVASGTRVYILQMSKSGARIVTANGSNISFNKFAVYCSINEPTIADDWKDVWRVVAGIEQAAACLIGDVTVKESSLLELRKKLFNVIKSAESLIAVSEQLMDNERLWNPSTLKDEVVIKTDHILTQDEMLRLASAIIGKVVE